MSLEAQLAENNALLKALNDNFTRLFASAGGFDVPRPNTGAMAAAVEAAPPTPVEAPAKRVRAKPEVQAQVAEQNKEAAKADGSPAISYEEVKAAVLNLCKAGKRDKALELMTKYGVPTGQKADAMPPANYAAFLTEAKRELIGLEALS